MVDLWKIWHNPDAELDICFDPEPHYFFMLSKKSINLNDVNYDKTTDMITLAPRTEAFAIFWIDYLNMLLAQDQFEILVEKLHKH